MCIGWLSGNFVTCAKECPPPKEQMKNELNWTWMTCAVILCCPIRHWRHGFIFGLVMELNLIAETRTTERNSELKRVFARLELFSRYQKDCWLSSFEIKLFQFTPRHSTYNYYLILFCQFVREYSFHLTVTCPVRIQWPIYSVLFWLKSATTGHSCERDSKFIVISLSLFIW